MFFRVTPVGVASIIASKIVAVEDIGTITKQLGMFVLTVLVGVLFVQLIIYQLIYFVLKRSNPYKFYAGIMNAEITAFATASA